MAIDDPRVMAAIEEHEEKLEQEEQKENEA